MLSRRNSISYKRRHCADNRPSRPWQGLGQPGWTPKSVYDQKVLCCQFRSTLERFRHGLSPKNILWPGWGIAQTASWQLGKQGILQTLSGESSRLVPSTPKASRGSATLLRYRCFVSLSVQPFLALGGTRPVCLPLPACALARGERSARSS